MKKKKKLKPPAPKGVGGVQRRMIWYHGCKNHPDKRCKTHFRERALTNLCYQCRTYPPNLNQMTLDDVVPATP